MGNGNLDKIDKDLSSLVGSEHVLRGEPMSRHTSFRVGGPADVLVMPDLRQFTRVIAYCREQEVPCLVIGNGSNLLCGDGGVEGVVVEIGKRMSAIEVHGCQVDAEAGALLSAVATAAAREGLTGFEFAAGIPGSVGGATVMNAGAYGGEMKDVLEQVTVLTPDGMVFTVPAVELELSYRHSAVPEQQWIVLSAALRLRKGRKADINARLKELRKQREAKQPLEYPSAGSTFKRPEGYFAGKLIEEAGLRGYRVGGAQVSEKHCGFVINTGEATAADVRTLMDHVRKTVREKFGVELEPEVKFIGRF